jgi:IS4 transposase
LGVCVPPREGRKHPARHDRRTYRKRHAVENFFQRLKMFLRVDRRLDKLAATFLALVQRASVLDDINRNYQTIASKDLVPQGLRVRVPSRALLSQ